MALTARAMWLVVPGLAAVAVWPSLTTVWWWFVGSLVLAGLDAALAPSPRTLTFTRSTTQQVRLGERATSTLVATNTGRRTVRGVLRDAWQPSAGAAQDRHPLKLRGGSRARFETALLPTRRGDRTADRVTVRSRGPLGIGARQRSVEVPGRVRALHPFPARRHLPSRLSVLRQIDGRSAVRTRGHGTEFDSLRDYVEGDDVRSIDWRATARRRNVVVRTWQPEQHRKIVIVIDSSRTSAGRVGDVPRLDAAMDAALLLTALAAHAHDRVHVIAGDRRVRVRTGGHTDRATLLHEVVTSLAPVEPVLVEADWPSLVADVTGRGHGRALVVLITPLESAAIEEGLLPVIPALTARHRVVVASVADPAVSALRAARESVPDVYAAAAAERSTALRQRTSEALERLGVHVIDADADDLPPRLADLYLRLKSEGLL